MSGYIHFTKKNSLNQIVYTIRGYGYILIEFISEVTVWLMPLVAMISLLSELAGLEQTLISKFYISIFVALVIELVALAFIHTTIALFVNKFYVQFSFMVIAIILYILIVMTISLGRHIEIFQDGTTISRIFLPVLLSTLAILSALNASFRANYLSQVSSKIAKSSANRSKNKTFSYQTKQDKLQNLEIANNKRSQLKDDKISLANILKSEGYKQKEIAENLQVSESTVSRWFSENGR